MADKEILFTQGALTDEHYKAFGLVVAEFAVLEWMLSECIIAITKVNPIQGSIVTANLGIRDLISILQNLVYQKFGEESEQKKFFSTLVSRINEALPYRNKVIHGQWHATDKSGVLEHWDFRHGKTSSVTIEKVNLGSIQKLAAEAAMLSTSALLFLDKYLDPPSNDKRPPLFGLADPTPD